MRPYIILKSAVSLDGRTDDSSPNRLLLSSKEDRDAVDRLRASCDAILIGARTLRLDNPSLGIRSAELRAARVEAGDKAEPIKVVVSASGNLPERSAFFSTGEGEKLVYATAACGSELRTKLSGAAEVVILPGEKIDLSQLTSDLYHRGVKRLLVEGGNTVIASFLAHKLADSLRVAIAPMVISDAAAPALLPRDFLPPDNMSVAIQDVATFGEMTVITCGIAYT